MGDVKYLGSRFCQGCGKLFQLTASGERRCASCQQPEEPAATATAPTVPLVKVAANPPAQASPPKPPRPEPPRVPRVKRTPGRRDWQPGLVTGTLPMLRALADAPEGLTTPQLTGLAGSGSSWTNALGTTRQLMLKQEARGRVGQAGTVPGDRTREVLLWKITNEGRRYVREAQDGVRGETPGAPAEPAAAGDDHTTIADAKPEPDYGELLYRLFPFPRARTEAGAYGQLAAHGYRTLGDLLYVTSWDLLALPGFGPRRLEAVRQALASRGMVLADELDPEETDPGPAPEPLPAPGPAQVSPRRRAANQGYMPRLPAGLVGTCLLVLGIEAAPMSAADVRAWLEREREHHTEIQVHFALHALGRTDRHYRRPPLAEIKEKRGGAAYWQLTECGREVLAEDAGEEGP